MQVYLVCAIQNPTKKGEDEGEVTKLIGDLKAVVANNEQMAGISYVREYLPSANLDKIEVVVRPFA